MVLFLSNSFFLPVLTSLLLWLSFPGGGEALAAALCGPYSPAPGSAWVQVAEGPSCCGLVCGLVHFTLLLYWIVIVLGRYGGLAWFISVPALLLLALYMAFILPCSRCWPALCLQAFPAAVSLWLLPSLWVGLRLVAGCVVYRFSLDGPGLCPVRRCPISSR